MLSKSEIEFLLGSKQVSPNYARYLKYSIKKKLEQLKQTLKILAENEYTKTWLLETVREITNNVRESSNTPHKNNLNLNLNNQNPSLKHQNNQKSSLFSQNKENLGVVGGEAPYVMRPPGFEPGLEAWQAPVLDQAGPRPR